MEWEALLSGSQLQDYEVSFGALESLIHTLAGMDSGRR